MRMEISQAEVIVTKQNIEHCSGDRRLYNFSLDLCCKYVFITEDSVNNYKTAVTKQQKGFY